MTNENDATDKKILTNIPKSENTRKTAFIQVPIELKNKVERYISEISDDEPGEQKGEDDAFTSLPDQGCFLVISLEKIEGIIKSLEQCLKLETSDGGYGIKAEIRRVISMLG